jgi:chemosensory pili system protein ChpB (putative protein-glutamate methylesterase)
VTELQVGLVVDTASKQIPLTQLILQAGHRVACHWVLSSGQAPQMSQPQVWLLDISSDYEGESDLVDQLLNQDLVPVLLIDSSEAGNQLDAQAIWMKRTQQRLQQLAGDIELHKQKAAVECWILAASTGGPAAVKAFIQALPENLPFAFVYIQHIDPKQGESLARSLSKSSTYSCEPAEHGAVLSAGKIMLLTSRERVEVMNNKTLCVHKNSFWSGSYIPSINQLVANIAHIYKQSCGLIIFTGMGDDGAASCRLLNQQGGTVWAQTPESSTSDSMPNAAIATNCVSFTGTPEQLAQALAAR